MTENTPAKGTTMRHFALLGGFKQRGDWQVPDDVLTVAAVGGADVDLTRATLPPVLTITKVSLVGGVELKVPADVNVEVDGFALVGSIGNVPAPTPSDRAPRTVRVRSYGVFGGVSVTRA